MSKGSAIQWTTHTFNIAWGCVEASAGCDNCYARTFSKRMGFDVWGVGADRRTFDEKYWKQPLKWDRQARRAGRRDRVFCSSMTDVFLNDRIINREREKLWPLIEATPNLDWQILTKHPERFKATLPNQLPPNVWLGVSIENDDVAWRADMLRETSAAVRFLSMEPFLGPLYSVALHDLQWIIVGGESGPGWRDMDLRWAREMLWRCRVLRIPFFFKQVAALHPTDEMIPEDLRIREYPVTA